MPANNYTPELYNYNGHEIRTVVIDGEPWFVAKDVCELLRLSDVSMSIRNIPTKHVRTSKVCTSSQSRDMSIVSEAGLYRLVMRSNKEEAQPFIEWVTEEVLPSIRKTGSYGVKKSRLELAREAVLMYEELERIEQEAESLRIELDDSKQWASIKRVQALTGESFKWGRLKAVAAHLGEERKEVFDANYGTVKSYSAKTWMEAYDIDITTVD